MLCAGAPLAQAADGWSDFRARFVAEEGRVVDTGQGGISHSEGQGGAMLLAEAAGDRASFDRLWRWTQAHLQVRDDKLLAWRWTAAEGVTDRNDATDGDLLVAWALARAFARWHDPAHLEAARGIARDLRGKALRDSAFGPLLLPGMAGFERPNGVVVNLSYWIFPALRELDRIDPAPEWSALERSGLALLGAARFGRWQLPADWAMVSGDKLAPAEGFAPRFGYDAIRVGLYLRWAGLDAGPTTRAHTDFLAFFEGARFMPAWASLADDSVDTHGASPGQRAVLALVAGKAPITDDGGDDYYSALLRNFVRLAMREAAGR
ncbi:MAG: glycosyl hydrolase family 8 [Ignavibacteria bacterium]